MLKMTNECKYRNMYCRLDGKVEDIVCVLCLVSVSLGELVQVKSILGNAKIPVRDAYNFYSHLENFFSILKTVKKIMDSSFPEYVEAVTTVLSNLEKDKGKYMV